MVGTNCTGEFARAWFASSNRPPVSIPLLLRRSVRPRCRHSARLPGASVSHGPSRSLTGWGRVFFCGLKRAGRINEQPLQIIHPSSGRRQVSAVTRRRIGSSSLNNETLCNKIFRGGSGQDKILRLRLLRRNNVFFSPYVANRTVHCAEVVLHSRCAPVGSSAPPSGISARAWSRRDPLRRGPNLLGIMRANRLERESVSSACPSRLLFRLEG